MTGDPERATGSTAGSDPRALSWRIGGMAGEGIDTAGDLFSKAAVRAGWHVWTSRHFPSRIRGGLTTYTTRLSSFPVSAAAGACDLVVALHEEAADVAKQQIAPDAVVLYDEKKVEPEADAGDQGRRWIGLDCTGIAKEIGEPRVRNMVALGASARLLGMPLQPLVEVVRERFDAKSREHRSRARLVKTDGGAVQTEAVPEREEEPPLVAVNRRALERGWKRMGDQTVLEAPDRVLEPGSSRLFVSGNEAFAYGALVAGCRFYAGYPITPATTIMEYLSEHLPGFGGVSLQVEDEMAALSMAIGAGFSGVRALTATSGPGLSLMAESIGLAASTETPVVIVDCMRPGPSTGMPTKTAQEDLSFLLAPSHAEAPHIVLAVEDLGAAYRAAVDAFNLAEQYQCPVVVAMDAALCIGKGDAAAFPLEVQIDRGHRFTRGAATPGAGQPGTGRGYERYAETSDGVVPLRAVPGDVGGRHYANSTEHAPDAYTTEDPGVRAGMVERRNRKMEGIETVHAGTRVEGDPEAPLGLVAVGSLVGVARETLARAREQGVEAGLLVLRRLWPLPREEVEEFMEERDVVLVLEQNSTGQLLRHLRSEVPEAHHAGSVRKYTGEPLTVDELLPQVLAAWEADR